MINFAVATKIISSLDLEIKTLPMKIGTKPLRGNECTVCLEEENLTMTKCGHCVCEKCLNDVLEKNYPCPECRENLNALNPLINKIKQNQIEGVKFILKQRPQSVNEQNEFLEIPLTQAIKCGYTNLVELLLKHGADPNSSNGQDEMPYLIAHENGEQLSKFLLFEYGANLSDAYMHELFFQAVEVGNIKILSLLVKQGQDILQKKNEMSALMIAAKNGDIKLAMFLISTAAAEGKQKIDGTVVIKNNTQLILEQMDKNENTPLMYAVEFDENIAMIELLLEKGANINHVNGKGWTPFMLSSFGGSVKNVEFLLKRKPDFLEQMDIFENTAIVESARGGNLQVLIFLMEKGANVRHQNKEGKTGLMFAAEKGHVEIVKFLIEKDLTTVSQISKSNEIAFDFAILNEQFSVVNYFFENAYKLLSQEMIEKANTKKCSKQMKKLIKKCVSEITVMNAIHLGSLEKLKYALDINPKSLKEPENGESGIYVAAKMGDDLMMKLLITYLNEHCEKGYGDVALKVFTLTRSLKYFNWFIQERMLTKRSLHLFFCELVAYLVFDSYIRQNYEEYRMNLFILFIFFTIHNMSRLFE